MPKETINPENLFPSRQYGFSQIVTSTGGKTIYMSGQVAWNEDQQLVGPGDLRAQTCQTLKNVEIAMHQAGGTLADIVNMKIYVVTDYLKQGSVISEALLEFFPGDHPPTSTWIGVYSLANEGFLIEIEPIAIID